MVAQAQIDVGGILRPQGRLDLTTALQPHHGPLGTRAAAHLLRRAGFGGTPDEIARFAAMRAPDAAAALIDVPSAAAVSPPSELDDDSRSYALSDGMDRAMIQRARRRAAQAAIAALQVWWLNRMLAASPLQEKMTLYFHGHFTSRGTPRFPWITYNQNALFRSTPSAIFAT